MKSAKRPLKLVWQNADPMSDIYHLTFKFFFKNGDGKVLFVNPHNTPERFINFMEMFYLFWVIAV
jgi:hypothetical protein